MRLHPALLVTLLLLSSTSAKTSAITITRTADPAPASTQYTNDTAFRDAILETHNFYRKEHNVTGLQWNKTSAKYALDWAGDCEFEHSHGPTGENLVAGYPNATASVDGWGSERSEYDFGRGDFSEKTGHFTQVVWKGTKSVGCGRKKCDGKGASPGWYVVCEYYPPGNVIGSFKENVQKQVLGKKNGDFAGGLEGGAVRTMGTVGREAWVAALAVGVVGWVVM